ncbi:hypothetical protein FGO68_gene9713 [Halteria grandinella]|uniref:Uncharacterized protein n=1 Tax=Halteria grandinella TaxID=5974 RepID=A0A8J8NRZ6_HALGN|nr:hypothetical protein FGO68_gene9713 [Halteria grandinella]
MIERFIAKPRLANIVAEFIIIKINNSLPNISISIEFSNRNPSKERLGLNLQQIQGQSRKLNGQRYQRMGGRVVPQASGYI